MHEAADKEGGRPWCTSVHRRNELYTVTLGNHLSYCTLQVHPGGWRPLLPRWGCGDSHMWWWYLQLTSSITTEGSMQRKVLYSQQIDIEQIPSRRNEIKHESRSLIYSWYNTTLKYKQLTKVLRPRLATISNHPSFRLQWIYKIDSTQYCTQRTSESCSNPSSSFSAPVLPYQCEWWKALTNEYK